MPNKTLNVDSGDRRVAGPSNDELITPMILPGDGVPLRLDFPDDDMSGIEEKHCRPPEEVLKSKSDHKADIWAAAIAVSTYFEAKERHLHILSRHGITPNPKGSSTDETQMEPLMTGSTSQSWFLCWDTLRQSSARRRD
jgi:hypothetical protein